MNVNPVEMTDAQLKTTETFKKVGAQHPKGTVAFR